MARSARGRSGPGYASLIIFVVLCLALIAGYVPVILGLTKRAEALRNLNNDIKAQLESPLGVALEIRAKVVASPADTAYDAGFFRPISQMASKGLKYDAFLEATGWSGEDPRKAMIEEFELEPEKGKDLRSYVLDLRRQLNDTQISLDKAARGEKAANDNYDRARTLLQEAKKSLAAEHEGYRRQLMKQKQSYDRDVAHNKQQWAEANKQQQVWLKKYQQERSDRKQDVVGLQKEIAGLTGQVGSLKTELAKRKPKPVKITEGRILQADAIEGIAIINLGGREQIENGEKFDVMRVLKGGERVKKGEIQVIRVDRLTSRADIMAQDEEHMVMKDDIVHRLRKVE